MAQIDSHQIIYPCHFLKNFSFHIISQFLLGCKIMVTKAEKGTIISTSILSEKQLPSFKADTAMLQTHGFFLRLSLVFQSGFIGYSKI